MVDIELNPRDTVMTNAAKLAAIGGGGTNCSAPLAQLVNEQAKGDLVVFVSDNESWVDARPAAQQRHGDDGGVGRSSSGRNPEAKLVCIDIQPYATTQALSRAGHPERRRLLGPVFDVIGSFARRQAATRPLGARRSRRSNFSKSGPGGMRRRARQKPT